MAALAALRNAVDWCPPWPSQPAFTKLIDDGYLDRHVVNATAATALVAIGSSGVSPVSADERPG